jgi:Mrp family chromosome partitioning ATPase/capsular polysaccharide biosynthesis protein
VKPELTFRRSLRLIFQRWWFVLLCGVGVAALAFGIVGTQKDKYDATTVVTINDLKLSTNNSGLTVLQPVERRSASEWIQQDVLSAPIAQAASKKLGGNPTAAALLANLTMTPFSGARVQLRYSGASDEKRASDVLRAYASALIADRVDNLTKEINDALARETPTDPSKAGAALAGSISALTNARSTVPGNFSFNPDPPGTAKVKSSLPAGPLAAGGGLLAGLAGGALLALMFGRMDRFVRRPDDIEITGVPLVDVDAELDPASVQLLRSELELGGVGTRLAVIAVTRPTRAEGKSVLSLELARAFSGVGTPTLLVSADLRGRQARSEPGLSRLLDGSEKSLRPIRLEENLAWLPEGDSTAPPETLFSAQRVERIMREAREIAAVIVVDCPAVLEDPEALPLIACSDIVLLTVHQGRTRWNPLGSAVALIQRVAKRPLHVCFDRSDRGSSVPTTAMAPAEFSQRVPSTVEVPLRS